MGALSHLETRAEIKWKIEPCQVRGFGKALQPRPPTLEASTVLQPHRGENLPHFCAGGFRRIGAIKPFWETQACR